MSLVITRKLKFGCSWYEIATPIAELNDAFDLKNKRFGMSIDNFAWNDLVVGLRDDRLILFSRGKTFALKYEEYTHEKFLFLISLAKSNELDTHNFCYNTDNSANSIELSLKIDYSKHVISQVTAINHDKKMVVMFNANVKVDIGSADLLKKSISEFVDLCYKILLNVKMSVYHEVNEFKDQHLSKKVFFKYEDNYYRTFEEIIDLEYERF